MFIGLGSFVSALVGLATLVALLPFPAYLSGWIQSFQKGMMSTVRRTPHLLMIIVSLTFL